VRDADLEYTYFVLDQFTNISGLHSILTARDGESALEDLHRALRGEPFLTHPLDPPVEMLVRKLYLQKNVLGFEHWYYCKMMQVCQGILYIRKGILYISIIYYL
jgi:hypothetical protein